MKFSPLGNLPTYAQVLIYVGGTAIVATVIVGGVFYYRAQKNTNTTPKSTPAATVYPYDGTYLGKGSVAQGLTSATVTVKENKISGTGTYSGTSNAAIGVDITGVVDAQGNVSGALSGSGSVAGYDVSGSGKFTGRISGTAMTVDYNASGSGGGENESNSGTLTLNKQ